MKHNMTTGWTYDKVTNAEEKIIALFYHIDQPHVENCLSYDNELMSEKLIVEFAPTFPTLQEAKAHAWLEKDKFVEGLD